MISDSSGGLNAGTAGAGGTRSRRLFLRSFLWHSIFAVGGVREVVVIYAAPTTGRRAEDRAQPLPCGQSVAPDWSATALTQRRASSHRLD